MLLLRFFLYAISYRNFMRRREKPTVPMLLDDFNSYVETGYLRSSRKNAARLERAVRELKAGKGKARKPLR